MKKILLMLVVGVVSAVSTSFAAGEHWQGKQRAVVLLLEWKNQPSRHNAREVEDTFFTQGKQSLRDFFLENSVGNFDITGDVRDWRKSEVEWDPNGSCDLDPIVNEAMKLFGNDLKVSDYDADGDGKIDNLFIVHSGRINRDRVGPDCTFTDYSGANHTIVFQSEGLGSVGDAIPIGFYVHEAGHAYFGFPDLYSDHYHGKYGIGMWGMMGLGAWGVNNEIKTADMFRYPSHFEPESKVAIGWVKPRVIQSTTQHVRIRPVEKSGDLVAIPVSRSQTYYLEYRSANGFSKNHFGHGMLIWKNYTLIQADGRDDLNHGRSLGRRPVPPISENFGDSSDPFPGSLNVTSYEDKSAGLRIENIKQNDDYVEFDVTTLRNFKRVPYSPARLLDHAPKFNGIEKL